ncbi:MAG TPA: hypothetical protein VHI55_04570 [Gaiellaceae bacterium]|nr:hypothetical protein [Gaiellaceae bacterium]
MRGAMLVSAILLLFASVGCGSGIGEQVSFDTRDADPDWSPNGQLIAFVSSRGGGGIYVIRPDGSGLRRLLRGYASDVDWSPNGRMLAFTRADGIYVVPSDRGRARRVLRGPHYSLPAWAPDGRRLAIVKDEPDDSTALYVVELDRHSPRRLLPRYRGGIGDARPGSPAALSETEPAWSPDGREIAFQAGGDGYIVIAHVDGGHRREIVAGGAYEPAWSADGRLIAYQCEGELCVTNADGSGQTRRLAQDGGDPSWAPDSRRLVFEDYVYGGRNYFSNPQSLSIIDVQGGDARKLTFGPKLPARP